MSCPSCSSPATCGALRGCAKATLPAPAMNEAMPDVGLRQAYLNNQRAGLNLIRPRAGNHP